MLMKLYSSSFPLHTQTAFAQVVERAAAPLRRGDELEWIGVYMPQ